MSAFLVNHFHIQALMAWSYNNKVQLRDGRSFLNADHRQTIADTLIKANVDNINYRYADDARPWVYEDRLDVKIHWIQAYKGLECLRYQCCDRPDYETSEASQIIEDLLYQIREGLCISERDLVSTKSYSQAYWEIVDNRESV